MTREDMWKWLGTAPLPVVLTICLTCTGALAGWVWVVAAEVGSQATVVAVAAEQAATAQKVAGKSDDKLDRLLVGVTVLQGQMTALQVQLAAVQTEAAQVRARLEALQAKEKKQ
jgi:hypothetical protein